MQEITSVSNSKIKEYSKLLQKKYREKSCLFIVEGKKAYEEILNANIKIEDVFVTDSCKNQINDNHATFVTEAVIKKLCSTDSPSNIVTIAHKQPNDISIVKNNNIFLIENIKDAGNLGTIIRSAAAFGFENILLIGNTIDIYNPKVIRSSAGNFFKVKVITTDISTLKNQFKDYNYIATALASNAQITPAQIDTQAKNIIMFGSEATGLTQGLIDLANKNLLIPMKNDVESLNLSTAVSVTMYQMFTKTF